jgi:lipoprotein NlpD
MAGEGHVMRKLPRTLRLMLVLLAASLAVACGTSRVYREGGARTAVRPASVPKYGRTVVVQRGDTLFRIATANGISTLDLAMWNDIAPPYVIHPGQRLRLYPKGAKPPASASTKPVTPPAGTTQPRPAPVVSRPASPVAWRWPADGSIVGRYAAGDATRQGVDIGGSSGAPVRAAGDGVVVYSGSGLVGYGELVIIKHNDAWLSAYGHNRTRLVNEGQVVKAGQQIAEMGRTGAARDMLHFEIRHNGKPVDPLEYLPKR